MRKLTIAILAIVALAGMTAIAQAATTVSWPLSSNADDTAGLHNGTTTDVTFSGGAAHFTSTSKIDVPYSPALSPEDANVTVSVDVNTLSKPGTGDLDFDLVRAVPTGKMYKVELFPKNGVGIAQCIFIGSLNGTATRITIKGTRKMNDGNWHTITCQKTATTVTLKTDGMVENSQNIQIGTIHLGKGKPFAIGYKPNTTAGGADHYIGAMRNVSVTIG